jgi:integrase
MCVGKGGSKSSIDQIYSAARKHWERSNCTPNPVYHNSIELLRKAKTREENMSVEFRKQAIAMPIEIMKKLATHLKDSDEIEQGERFLRSYYWCLFVVAFQGFFRIDEVAQLKISHVKLKENEVVINVYFRKTGVSNVKQVYPRVLKNADELAISVWDAVSRFMNLYPKEGNDNGNSFFFPSVRISGKELVLDRSVPFAHDVVKAKLNNLLTENDLVDPVTEFYTLHTFRRGGAMYRFQYAEQRFPLTGILYWGGWSKSESLYTLASYLLEERLVKETTHSYLLRDLNQEPTQNNREVVGAASNFQFATDLSLSHISAAVDSKLAASNLELATKVANLSTSFSSQFESLKEKLTLFIPRFRVDEPLEMEPLEEVCEDRISIKSPNESNAVDQIVSQQIISVHKKAPTTVRCRVVPKITS